MSVNAGSAVAYLELDSSKFQTGLKTAVASLKQVSNNTATTTQKFKALGSGLTSIGSTLSLVSVPLLGIGAGALKTASDFKAGMSKVSALSGATGKDLEMLEKVAKEMGATTKFSATEASDALSYMALAGWDAEQMAAGLEPSLKLAGAAGMDLALTTDIVTDTMSMFGMEASEATKMTDMLAYAQANSNTDVQQLGEALKYCGASANAMGYDLADTTALLGTFADQGLKGSSAGTTLNSMFRDMKKNAKDGAIAIGKTNVAIVDSKGNYRDMNSILADVEKATKGMTTAQRDQALSSIWGTEALKGVNMAFQAGSKKIKDFESAIRNSDGAASKMYDTMQNNLKGSIDNLKSAFEGVMITIGERLIPIFQKLVDKVTNALTWFNNLSPSIQNVIIAVGGFIAVLGPLLLLIGGLIIFAANVTTALGTLSAAFAAGGTAATIFGGALTLLTGPVGLVIGAIAGIIAVGYLLISNWDEISTFASEIWNNIVTTIDNAIGWIAEKIGLDWNLVKENIFNVWESIKTNISEALGAIWNVITETWNSIFGDISEALSKIKNIIGTTWEFIKTEIFQAVGRAIDALLAGDWEGFKQIISNMMEKIKIQLDKAWEAIKNIISNTLNSIKNKISDAWENIKSIISTKLENIKSSISNAWNNMKSTINNALNNIKKICSTIWTGIKNDIKNKVNGIWTDVKNCFNNIIKSISDSLSKAWDTAKGWWDKIKSIFKNPIKAVVSIFKKDEKAKSISVEDPNPISTFDNPNDLKDVKFNYYRDRSIVDSSIIDIENTLNRSLKDLDLKVKDKIPKPTNNDVNIYLTIDKMMNSDNRSIEEIADELAFYLKRTSFA